MEPPAKRIKTQKSDKRSEPKTTPGTMNIISRCKVCRQDLDDPELRMFPGPPNDALEEEVALFDPKLSLFNGTEDISFEDSRPSNKLTHFRLVMVAKY